MSLPVTLNIIVDSFFTQQCLNSNKLKESERSSLVEQLIIAYDRLDKKDRVDVLIPAEGRFLKEEAIKKEVLFDGSAEYYFQYKWPSNEFDGLRWDCILAVGEKYDRIGGEDGTYLSPLKKDGTPESYLARAIPYYIPETNIEDSPSYHCYTVKVKYAGEVGRPVQKGIIAQAFWDKPRDGGGMQIKLPKKLGKLKGVNFSEC